MAKTIANPPVTMTAEALKQVIAQAIAEHDAAKAEQAKSDNSADMDRLCIKGFVRAGYKAETIQPRQNVLTYAKWVEKGFKVKEGEHATKVKNLRLFHVSQVEPITKKEQAEYLAKRAAKSADKLPLVSPVEMPKAQPAPKPPVKNAKVLIAEPGNA
jgi:hypothetical protein